MKRFVAMLLSLLMLFSILPVTALAEGEGETPSPATPTYVWDKDEDGNPTCKATLESVSETATVENGKITSVVKTPATCSVKGTTTYTATFDDASFTDQEKDYQDIATVEHTLEEHSAIDATCEKGGNKAYFKCSVCQQYFLTAEATEAVAWSEIQIPAAHNLTKYDAKDPTCKEAGNKAYWQCSVCEKYFLTEEATEEVDWDDIEIAIDPDGHKLTHVNEVPATCVKEGTKEYWKCEYCSHLYADSEGSTETTKEALVIPIDSTNHSEELTHNEELPATCTEEGIIEYWYCDDCTHLYSDSEGRTQISEADLEIPIDPAAHKLEHVEAKDATCSEVGNKEYWQCEYCHKYYLTAEATEAVAWSEIELAKVEHAALEYHAEEPATCSKAGMAEHWYCPVCKTYFSDSEGKTEVTEEQLTIYPTSHPNVIYNQPLYPTCTEDGHEEYWYCPDCETYFSDKALETVISGEGDVLLEKTEHKDDEGESLLTHYEEVESTYYKKGNIEYWVCSECGKYYADEACTDERKADKVEPEGILTALTEIPVPTMELDEVDRGVIKITAKAAELPGIDGEMVTDAGFKVFRYVTKDGDETSAVRLGFMTKSNTEGEYTYTDKTAVAGIGYTYFIKAYVSDGTNTASSDPSNEEEITVGPGAISTIKASVSGTAVTLSWSAAAEATAYDIYRSTSAKGDFELINESVVTKVSYNDQDLEPGTIYYYYVRALVKTDEDETTYIEGPCSQTVEAIIPLSTPSITVTKQDASHVLVQWNDITGADCYYVNVSGYQTLKETVEGENCITLRLAPNGSYSITVTACCTSGAKNVTSKASSAKSVTLALTAPTLTVAKAETPYKVFLQWTAVPGADKYRVYCYDSGSAVLISEQSETVYQATTTSGSLHYYAVTAVWYYENTKLTPVESKFSTRKCVSTILTAPVLTVKKTDVSEIEIKWAAIAGASSYELYRKTNLDSGWDEDPYIAYLTNDDIPFTDETVAGRTYYYKMVAIYDDGSENVVKSNASAVKSVTLPLASPTVTAKKVSGSQINLTWKAVAGADEYHVYVSTVKNSFSTDYEIVSEAPDSENPYEYEALPGKTYYFKVVSVSAVRGDEQESSKASVKSVTLPFIAPVIKLKKGSDNTVTITWKAVAGATSYEIYQSKNSKSAFDSDPIYTLDDTGEKSYSAVVDILPGNTYYYKVRAVAEVSGKTGYSAYSKILYTKIAFAAPSLTLKKVTGTDTLLRLTWKSVAVAQKYRVYQSYDKTSWGTYVEVDADDELVYEYDAIPGKTCYFKVVGVCEAGGEEATGAASIKYYKIPFAAPTITVKRDVNNDISISWKKVTLATSYKIQVSTTKTFAEGTVEEWATDDLSILISGYSSGKYYIRVRAIYNGLAGYSEGSWSKVKYITVK